MKVFPFVEQLDSQDCGLACLKMITKFHRRDMSFDFDSIPDTYISKSGISISALENCAKFLYFNTFVCKTSFDIIKDNIYLPAIFFYNQNHFVVVYKITSKHIYVADPAFGKKKYLIDDFISHWYIQDGKEGLILMLEPQKKTTEFDGPKKDYLIVTLKQFTKRNITSILFISITILLSTIIEFIFPFFTQRIIDNGITFNKKNLIYIIISGQFALILCSIALDFYRSWIFINLSNKVSLSMITSFLDKLLKLPLRFFNSRNSGDIIQRIRDHERLSAFLSHEFVQIGFAIFSIIVYVIILLHFSYSVLGVVVFFSTFEIIWILLFLKKMKYIDYKNFSLQAQDQNKLFESVTTIQEIKLNNLEKQTTNQWRNIQINIFKNNLQKLKVEQKYECYKFLDHLQNIIITLICALSIINQKMSLGVYFSIMMILGGLNKPISDIINFILKFKLVKISCERINDVFNKKDELDISSVNSIADNSDITIKNLSFSYDGINNVLNDINIIIPNGKTTAIVGLSGSGKTTLLKLILKFYQDFKGNIIVGNDALECIDNTLWRDKCGAILQDSAIFSESIVYNVSLNNNPDMKLFVQSLKLANIYDFVKSLPLCENTIIGDLGQDLSQGQKQRILIARQIYKNPEYIFFDEATNSLDAENEKIIMHNINQYFKGKTFVVVAHRLSTVKNADQIVVIDKGKIAEVGKHDDLLKNKGRYYELVQNQLEI